MVIGGAIILQVRIVVTQNRFIERGNMKSDNFAKSRSIMESKSIDENSEVMEKNVQDEKEVKDERVKPTRL